MNEQKSALVKWTSWAVGQINLLISENLTEILPILLPLPFASIISYELQKWVLPFENETARWIVAIVGGITLEFFGATALDVAQRAKAYNLTKKETDPGIAVWPAWMGLAVYILVAVFMVSVGAILPALGYQVEQVAPILMYGFILMLPFGYWFISTRSIMNTVYAQREIAKLEQKQARVDEVDLQRQQMQLERERFELERLRVQNKRLETEAEALKTDAETRRQAAEARRIKAEADRIKAQKTQAAPPPVQSSRRMANGHGEKIRARDISFEEIDRLKEQGYKFDPLTPTFMNKYKTLVAAFGHRQFGGGDISQTLECGSSAALQTIRMLYADGRVAIVGNGVYQLMDEGKPN